MEGFGQGKGNPFRHREKKHPWKGENEEKMRRPPGEGDHKKKHKKTHGPPHSFRHKRNQEQLQMVPTTLQSNISQTFRSPHSNYKRGKNKLRRQQSQVRGPTQFSQNPFQKPQHSKHHQKHNFFQEFHYNNRRRHFFQRNYKDEIPKLIQGIFNLGMSQQKNVKQTKIHERKQEFFQFNFQYCKDQQQYEQKLQSAIGHFSQEQIGNELLRGSSKRDNEQKKNQQQNPISIYLTRIPMHIIKILKEKNQIDNIVEIIFSTSLDFLDVNWSYRKIMIEIFLNLINFQKFKPKDEMNIYASMNNSLKNSLGLRKTLIERKVNNPEHFVQLHQKYLLIKRQISCFQPINSQRLSQVINNQLDSLQQLFKDGYNNLQKEGSNNQSQIQYIMNTIISSQYTEKLKKQLIFKLKIPGELRQKPMEAVCHLIIKIFILSSLKSLMIQSFNSDVLSYQTEIMSNRFEECIKLTQKSNIQQFQLFFKSNRQIQGQQFLRENLIDFYDDEQNKELDILQNVVGFYLQMLIFMKKTLALGFGIQLQDDNICHRYCRFAYKLGQPFRIYKNQKQLVEVNKDLVKILQSFKQKAKDLIDPNKIRLYQIYSQNLQFLKNFYRQIILSQIDEQQQYNKFSAILDLFGLDFNLQKLDKEQLIYQCKIIKEQLTENVDEQIVSINDLQNLDVFYLLEQYFIDKFQRIIRKIFSIFCYKSSTKVSLRVYSTFIEGLQNSDESLTIMYNNIFDQEMDQQQIAKKRQDLKTYLPSIQLKKENDQFSNIYFIAKKLSKINNQKFFTGILGVQQYKDDYWFTQIKQQYLDQTKTIQFCELNPEEGRSLLFKKMLPADLNSSKSPFIEAVLKGQNKSQKKEFGQQDLKQVVQIFIQNVRIIFNNFTSLGIRCPLILIRHLILHKPLRLDNYPEILPQINILRCIVENNLANSTRPVTFMSEYYINSVLRVKNLSLPIHNQLICHILLNFLVSNKSEKKYLQQIFQFVNNVKITDQNVFQYLKEHLNFVKTKNNSHIYFTRLHSRAAIQLFKQILNISQFPFYANEKQFSNKISQLIRGKFADQNLFLSRRIIHKNRSHSYLHNNLQYNLYCFKLIKYSDNYNDIFSQNLSEDLILHLENLFKLHYCNMAFLYKQYQRQVRRDFNDKNYKYLSLVCELSNYNISEIQIDYKSLFQLIKFKVFQAHVILQNYGFTHNYSQSQYCNINNLNERIKQKQQFFYSISPKAKFNFLKGLIELLQESKPDNLNIQIWNLDIMSIELACKKRQVKQLNLFDFQTHSSYYEQSVKPSFGNWQWFRCFGNELYHMNLTHYTNFYRFLCGDHRYNQFQFCLQTSHSCLNIPKYHQRVIFQQTAQKSLQFSRRTPEYDIGNIGYVMALILIRQKLQQGVNCLILKKVNDFYQVQYQSFEMTINSDLKNIVQYNLPPNLSKMILIMMSLRVKERINKQMQPLLTLFQSSLITDQIAHLPTIPASEHTQ